ncbi:MAG: hypothetical protein QOG03_1848 [Actinomycetota bacterium]|jgi:hypothetical protein|nr:hypothetical protein [Actinomycetota bacterium]
MRKILTVAAALAMAALAGSAAHADNLPAGIEGCVASSPGANVWNPTGGGFTHDGACSYVAKRSGGYVAGGSSWSITVGATTFSAANGDPACQTSVIAIGDSVTVNPGSNGFIAAGSPTPSATDGQGPDSGNSTCP